MSRLNQLIAEYCPDGVEYKHFDSVCQYIRGVTYSKNMEATASDKNPWRVLRANNITLGQNILNFDDVKLIKSEARVRKDQLLSAGDILICAGSGSKEHVGKVAYIENDIGYTFGGFMAVIRTCKQLLGRFVYHVLTGKAFKDYLSTALNSTTINNLNSSVMASYMIPVPPLPVQREIVRILDNFTELTTELTAELTARKKQYKYYSQKLLNLNRPQSSLVPIGELGRWSGGKTPSMNVREYWEGGSVPWISSKDMKLAELKDTQDYITDKALHEAGMTLYPKNCVAVVTRSGILKHTFPVAFVPFATTVNQDIKLLNPAGNIMPRYAYHVLQAFSEDIRVSTKKQGGTVDSLDFQKVLNYQVPLPSPEIQERIVNVLDNFEAICSDLNTGLPAEIEARQKQYEYYRDKLLTFRGKQSPCLTSTS